MLEEVRDHDRQPRCAGCCRSEAGAVDVRANRGSLPVAAATAACSAWAFSAAAVSADSCAPALAATSETVSPGGSAAGWIATTDGICANEQIVQPHSLRDALRERNSRRGFASFACSETLPVDLRSMFASEVTTKAPQANSAGARIRVHARRKEASGRHGGVGLAWCSIMPVPTAAGPRELPVPTCRG